MRSRTISDASAQVPIRSERKIEGPRPATRQDYHDETAATLLALAMTGQELEPSQEGPLGCQVELLEEFLDAFVQVPNVTMPNKQ